MASAARYPSSINAGARRQSSDPYFSSGTLMTTSAAVMARRVDARIIASSVFPATPNIV